MELLFIGKPSLELELLPELFVHLALLPSLDIATAAIFFRSRLAAANFFQTGNLTRNLPYFLTQFQPFSRNKLEMGMLEQLLGLMFQGGEIALVLVEQPVDDGLLLGEVAGILNTSGYDH